MQGEHLKVFVRQYWILLVCIAAKIILQLMLVNPVYELHRDEFLYLDQAFHPAAGYVSVPPFTAFMARIIYWLGSGLFWVRMVPAFFGAATILVAWLTVEALDGKLPAKVLTSVLLIFSVYTRINVLFQPNSFDILAWTVIFYLLIKYFSTHQAKWLFLLAFFTAIGLYNKYTILFLIAGLFTGLLFTGQRSFLSKQNFYVAAGFSLLLFLPNIIWQISNDFPVIHHMQALQESQLVNIKPIDFLFDQVKFGLVGIPTIAACWALLFYKPFQPYRFIFWTFIVVTTLFTISHAKSYYSLGLYPVLLAIGCVYLEIVSKKWKPVVFTLLALLHVSAFIFIVKYLMPYQSPSEIVANKQRYEKMGLLRWEDGMNHPLPQDFADMLGWQEMADKALAACQMVSAGELQNTLVYCDNYGQAGALNYYNRNKMPEAFSLNTDYIYWLPKNLDLQNMVLVGKLPDQQVITLFEEYKVIGTVENEYAREKGTQIILFLHAQKGTGERFLKMAADRKERFDIF